MIEDINDNEYFLSLQRYSKELRNLRQPSVSITVGLRTGTHLFTSLFIVLNNGHCILFSHNPTISHHP